MNVSDKWKRQMRKVSMKEGGIFRNPGAGITKIPTVVISLGGLGGKTLNMLKRKMLEAYGESDRVWYLAVDTMEDETKELYAPDKGGNLKEKETIVLFDKSTKYILTAPNGCPSYIELWKKKDALKQELDSTGAKHTRQIGRIMLTSGNSYARLRGKLMNILGEAKNKAGDLLGSSSEVNIIIVAGISGGTGSGTIIDISYLIRDIMDTDLHFSSYKLSAYVYMPDVQYHENGIQGNPSIIFNLNRNGYAALKEIDYFMNLSHNKGEYKLALSDSSPISSKADIFDSCTLVSSINTARGTATMLQTMDALTDDLREILGDINYQNNGIQVQLAKAFSSNAHATLISWYSRQGRDKQRFPKSANYNYQVLGYSSVYIPKDEIINYCIDKMYLAMIEEFHRISEVQKEHMDSILSPADLGSIDDLFSFVKGKIEEDLEIRVDIPTKREVKRDEDDTLDTARAIAEERVKSIPKSFSKVLEKLIVEQIDPRLDEYFRNNGPFFVLRLLEYELTDKKNFSGLLEYLKLLKEEVHERYKETVSEEAKSRLKDEIDEAKEEALRFYAPIVGKNDEEAALENYSNLCCDYAKRTIIDKKIYEIMETVLDELYDYYQDKNNSIYSVYTTILTEISDMMKNDADYVTKADETVGAEGATFTYDVLNFKSGTAESDRLKKYLEGFISPVSVKALCDEFIKNIREHKDIWLNMEDSEALKREIRAIFENYVRNTLLVDAIEKFLVVAYSPNPLTIEEVDDIWGNHEDVKTNILQGVAHTIAMHLMTQSVAMAKLATNYSMDSFSEKKYVGVLRSTPVLSNLIRQEFAADPTYQVADSNVENRISCTNLAFGIPLYLIEGLKQMNADYEEAFRNKEPAIGLHMDEVSEKWQEFPQPYNLDFAVKVEENKVTKNTQREYEILKRVKLLADQAMKNGCIYKDEQARYYVLLDIRREPESSEVFSRILEEKYESSMRLSDFMKLYGYGMDEVILTRTDSGLNCLDLDGEGSVAPAGEEPIGDFYKLIRMSRYLTQTLERNVEKFEALYQASEKVVQKKAQKKRQEEENQAAVNKALDRLGIFANALHTGTISRQKDTWTYVIDEKEDVLVDLSRDSSMDKTYGMYHAFAAFCELDEETIEYLDEMSQSSDFLPEEEFDAWLKEIKKCYGREGLGKLRAKETIIRQANMNRRRSYKIAMDAEQAGNPYDAIYSVYQSLVDFFGL